MKRSLALLASLVVLLSSAVAQEPFPTRPVRIVVPAAPGSLSYGSPGPGSPAQLAELIRPDSPVWRDLVRKSGAKSE